MCWIVIAIASMAVISTAHHLGFIDKAYIVCGDIVKCPMCCCLWGTLLLLLILGCQFINAIALSFLVAYLSNWFSLVLNKLAEIYDCIWQKNRKTKTNRSNKKILKNGKQ